VKRISTAVFALAVGGATVLGFSVSANAAPSQKANKLTCFDGDGGVCTRNGSNDFTLSTGAGGYSGAYVPQSGFVGRSFSEISLGFSYDGDVSGGSPRYSIPVDYDGDGAGEGYVFIDAPTCNDGAGNVAPNSDPTCAVQTPMGYYQSYADFLAAEPTATVADNIPFVIADQPGTVRVFDIQLARVAPGELKK
jgi:hypothetical protein